MEGIKKLLSASSLGLPNWAWLLIVGGGIAAAIIVPKVFPNLLGGPSTDTGTATDTGTTSTPVTDTSGGGLVPSGGVGGGGGTTDGTTTPTPVTPPATTTPPDVFPPVQPQPPPPPASTAPKDQCHERQTCIDFHLQHTCGPMKDAKKKAECEQHWILKCGSEHPCGHSTVPTVHDTNDVWPFNRQPRRGMAYIINGRAVRKEDIGKSERTRVDLPPIPETELEQEEETHGNI